MKSFKEIDRLIMLPSRPTSRFRHLSFSEWLVKEEQRWIDSPQAKQQQAKNQMMANFNKMMDAKDVEGIKQLLNDPNADAEIKQNAQLWLQQNGTPAPGQPDQQGQPQPGQPQQPANSWDQQVSQLQTPHYKSMMQRMGQQAQQAGVALPTFPQAQPAQAQPAPAQAPPRINPLNGKVMKFDPMTGQPL